MITTAKKIGLFPFALSLSKGAIGTLLALTLFASGCLGSFDAGGGNDGPGGGGSTAQMLFVNTVQSSLSSKCGGCHAGPTSSGPNFLGASPANYYNFLTSEMTYISFADPSSSRLLTKGVHSNGGAPAFTSDESQKIIAWLMAENNASGDMGTTPSDAGSSGNLTPRQQLEKFAACMTEADWNSTGMNTLQDAMTGEGGRCRDCHSTGLGYAHLNANSTENFTKIKNYINLQKLASYAVKDDGSFDEILPTNRLKLAGTGSHPSYTLNQVKTASVDNFFNMTKTRWMAGNCP